VSRVKTGPTIVGDPRPLIKPSPTISASQAAFWSTPSLHSRLSDQQFHSILSDQLEQSHEEGGWNPQRVGYMPDCFIQAHLPHSCRNIDQFSTYIRKSGDYQLQIRPDPDYGLPYGTLPRLILIWLSQEVRKTRQASIYLGDSLADFMRSMNLSKGGGKLGTYARLRDQMRRLFSADIRFAYKTTNMAEQKTFSVQAFRLWDNDLISSPSSLGEGHLLLSDGLFTQMLENSVPLHLPTVQSLSSSPMALDIYFVLSKRLFQLSRPVFIPYERLAEQFGATYARPRDFEDAFRSNLLLVLGRYSEAKVEIDVRLGRSKGIRLNPSSPHVAPLRLASVSKITPR
jgi:hypothetical protein